MLPAPAATGILPTLSLRILPQMPEPMPRRFAECVCLVLPQHSSAFPIIRLGRLPASFREHDFPRVGFRGCSYFVMFRPPSLLSLPDRSYRCKFPRRAAEAFYIRAERASLPSHASDMLSARLQAIGGTRTFTSQDSQPCRLLPTRFLTFTSVGLPPTEPISFLSFPGCTGAQSPTPPIPLSTLRWVPHGSNARLEAERIATPFS